MRPAVRPKDKLCWVAFITVGLLAGLNAGGKNIAGKNTTADPLLKTREEMVILSRQLGVTCTHCHDMENLKSDKKKAYKMAKDHMRITELLNEKGFKGKPKVDCYLCHRGQLNPPFREPVGKEPEH